MSASLARDLDVYAAMAEKMHLYDELAEVENVLIWRDVIQERIAAGERLSDVEERELEHADDLLVAQRDRLVRRFPWVFENSASIPRERWWWHLDEGPQVRDEARRAA